MRSLALIPSNIFSRIYKVSVSLAIASVMSIVPLVVSVVDAAAVITSSSPLTAGTYGTAYSTTITGTGLGGSPAWSITAGALPGGLSIGASDGVISGTPTATGTFNFTVQVIGSSTTTMAFDLTINTAPLTVTANSTSKNYGSVVTFAGTEFITSALVSGDSVDSVTLTSAGAAGTATVAGSPYSITPSAAVGTGLSNYAIVYVNGSLTVNAAPITVTANAGQTKVYGDSEPASFTYSITSGALYNSDTFAGALSRDAGETVASYAINQNDLALSGNYSLSYVSANFSITLAPLTITANSTSKNYGDTVTLVGTEFATSGLVSGDSVTSVTLSTTGDVATATVAGSPYSIAPSAPVGTGLSNYTISYVNGSLTVNPIALTITANSTSKNYGDTVTLLGTEFTTSTLLNGDTVTSVTLTTAGDVATATVAGSPYSIVPSVPVGTGLSNYTIAYTNGSLTVSPIALTVTANNATKTYGSVFTFIGTEFTTSTLINGDTVTSVTLTSAGSAGTATVSGSPYAIVPSAAAGSGVGNYTITYANGSFTVNTASVTVTADAAQTKVYGSSDPTFTYSITSGALYNGDTFSGVLSRASGEDVAAYAITQNTLALDSNYVLTFVSANFSITKAATTVSVASDTNPAADTATITFTATISGPTPVTGPVTFKDGAATIGTGTAVLGVATLSTTLSANNATHPITAVYLGDINHFGSTSSSINQDILPKIKVIKVVVNDNSGSLVDTAVDLFVDSGAVLINVSNTFSVGSHKVSEYNPSGYSLLAIAGDCSSNGNITLALNDNKTCILTNDDIQPKLTVIVHVTNDDGGLDTATGVTITMNSLSPLHTPSPATFVGDEVGTLVAIDAGTFSVDRDLGLLDGRYTETLVGDCSGVLLPGDDKICEVDLDDIPATLTLSSSVINDNGGTLTTVDFLPLTVDLATVDSGVSYEYSKGTHTVASPSSTTYSRSISGDCVNPDGTIILDLADNKSCLITYNDIPATFTIIKKVVNNDGGAATDSDFILKISGSGVVLNGVPTTLNVGDYLAGEVEDFGYSHAFSGDCSLTSGTFHVGLAEDKTCTITNNDRAGYFPKENSGGNGNENSQVNGGRSGHGVGRLLATARHIVGQNGFAPGAFGGGDNGPITDEEKEKICTMQRADTFGDNARTDVIGAFFATLLGRTDPVPVIAALKDPALCAAAAAVAPAPKPVATVRLNKDGMVLSSNPVWNACIKGKATLGLIKSNRDTITSRQGIIVTERPMSCDDYHTNSLSVWSHPDFEDLDLTLDKKGRLVGGVPTGYIAVRDSAKNVASEKGKSVVAR